MGMMLGICLTFKRSNVQRSGPVQRRISAPEARVPGRCPAAAALARGGLFAGAVAEAGALRGAGDA